MKRDIMAKGLVFLTGGVIGSIATWFVVKNKYEQIISDKNEEIEFLRDRYSSKKTDEENTKTTHEDVDDTTNINVKEIRDKVQKLGYANESIMKERTESKSMNRPYVIPPEETWEQDYPTISLTFYEKDKVLTDEKDKIIKNSIELVGDDFAEHFGEYEDDCVYVRNDDLGVYYEILRDHSAYSEVMR